MENNKTVVDSKASYQAKLEPVFLKTSEFPVHGVIMEAEPVQGRFGGEDIRLLLDTDYGARTFDAWKDNKNVLIYSFGGAIRDWVGKEIYIALNGQKRVVSVVLAKGTS